MKCTTSINPQTRLSELWSLLDYWYAFPPLFPFPSIGLDQLVVVSPGAELKEVSL